jgi:hypothetical protein
MIFYPSTKEDHGFTVGELVLWCGLLAPKERLDWYHGLARGAPFKNGQIFSILVGEYMKDLDSKKGGKGGEY